MSRNLEIVFFIDDKEFKTDKPECRVRAVLFDYAGLEPRGVRLARRIGPELRIYEDPEEIIRIENGTRFLTERVSKEVVFFIDKQKFKTEEREFSVRVLLVDFAKEDPSQTTLARREGNHLEKYADLNQIIHIKDDMHFIVLHNSPTPVS